ncbi:hypothetical protein V6N00_00055 [Tersicoccus sp. MR15.9]|uniref:hypothetical protein n=1 Tax=Tersicoccus mangrovi TaxID=3121635 RepID=UPI002FE6A5B9
MKNLLRSGAAAAIALGLLAGGGATTASAAAEAPATASSARCFVPSTANQSVLRTLKAVGDKRGITYRVRLAMFETAWVESHANNLKCGTGSSVGVFQQTSAWGTYAQRTNVTWATNRFLDQAIPNARRHPSWTAGQVAQSVQRSAYPTRYDQAKATATRLIAQLAH